MPDNSILQEWLDGTDTESGGAYIANRYGEGAPGNPVFGYDRETVTELIRLSTAAKDAEIARLLEALEAIAAGEDEAQDCKSDWHRTQHLGGGHQCPDCASDWWDIHEGMQSRLPEYATCDFARQALAQPKEADDA